MIKPIIIAEACCNHIGNIEIAKKLIIAAKNNGADYIKFQKRDINTWILRKPDVYNNPHPNVENSFGNTYAEHRKFLEFNINEHKILNEYCKKVGINYCCSVFDIESVKEIIKLNPKIIKIPSACNMNFELLSFVCDNFDGEIHLSLGMTKKVDIDKIVKFFIDKKRNNSLVLYACTSAYPLKEEDVCLLEISYLKEKYSNLVKAIGYSGHHQGTVIDIAAYSLGANFIERHFTLDNKLKGTDQKASIVPKQLQELRKNLDSINMCLTYKTKDILDVELSNKEKLKW